MTEKFRRHAALVAQVQGCERCALCRERTNPVPGEGDLNARLMIIGEGPGAQEDAQGRPFVGRAGSLLEQMLDSIAMAREMVYIANVVKCRPPQNRAPKEDEVLACRAFLDEQIAIVDPEIVLLLGATALNAVISRDLRITKSRGQWFDLNGRPVIASFHPAALLRDPSRKVDAFFDMLTVDRRLKGID
jgi:uracil-DNA glycosylase family 4